MIQENSPFIQYLDGKVLIPTGLLVEKWLYYYYPLFRMDPPVKQIKSSDNLAFGPYFRAVVQHYETQGSLSKLRSDLHRATVPESVMAPLTDLLMKMQETVTRMPMKHLGQSLNGLQYDVYQLEQRRTKLDLRQGITAVIASLGSFSIPQAYGEAFTVYGSFISGRDSILMQWAQFTEAFTRSEFKTSQVLEMLGTEAITDRKTSAAQSLFQQLKREGRLVCIWTGKPLEKWDVDHIIPFSIWKNNDLWNMLPCSPTANEKKSDKIPSTEALKAAKGRILEYWQLIRSQLQNQFSEEIQLALLGTQMGENWAEDAFQRLSRNCQQLIDQRGYDSWQP